MSNLQNNVQINEIEEVIENVIQGKTTLIYKFLEKDEITKPTLAMDYCFGRKTSKQMTKGLIHVWEVGHLTASLISAALAGASSMHPIELTTLIIMLNLSTPHNLWHTLEECLTAARSALAMTCDRSAIKNMKNKRGKVAEVKYGKYIDPFPLDLCIVGGQYDKIKNSELATKQLIGQTLRATAFHLRADLQYYSSKDSTLVRKMRETISYYGFGSQTIKDSHCDYKNALIIPAGFVDSFATSELDNYPTDDSKMLFNMIKNTYVEQFLYKKNEDKCELENLINDPNFSEAVIDNLRKQRDEKIETNLQEMMDGKLNNIVVIPDPH